MRARLIYLTVCGLVGCSAVPPLTAFIERPEGHQELLAQNRTLSSGLLADETFQVGPYRVVSVERHATVDATGARVEVYRFSVLFKGQVDGTCWAAGEASGAQERMLRCECGAQPPIAQLELASVDATTPAVGKVTLGNDEYPIRSLGERLPLHQSVRPGYVVGTPLVMAVGLAEPGQLWLDSSLASEARGGLVCLATGLLLYRPAHVSGPPPLESPSPRTNTVPTP